jgi:predicted metal-binding protein
LKFEKLLLFSGKFDLEDSYDFEGCMAAMKKFKYTVDAVDKTVKPYLIKYLLLSNEGCGRCVNCTYPDAPCRFPNKLFHSIEGYGIFVSKLATQAGIKYNNGERTITYFGALLYNTPEGG